MRRIVGLFIIALGAVVLAGCSGGGNGEDAPPTADVTLAVGIDGRTLEDMIEDATRPLDQQPPTAIPTAENPLAIETEEPTAGELFDRVVITRSGGRGQLDYYIEIFPDGRFIFNDEEGQLPQQEINALQARFDEIRVYSIANNHQLWPSNPDVFRYVFHVQMGVYQTTLEGENAYVPPEIRDLIGTAIDYSRYLDQ